MNTASEPDGPASRSGRELKPGDEIGFRTRHSGEIETEPASVPMRVERRGRVAVIVPDEPVPPLTAGEASAVLERERP